MTTATPINKAKDATAEVVYLKRQSQDWMMQNFWPEWEQVYKNYLCVREARPDPNDPRKPDLQATSVAMPDTWGWATRVRARLTAQIPNVRFRTDHDVAAELISRVLMYQWDRSQMQVFQKKHALQAILFGWSVKSFRWVKDMYLRRKRVDLFRALEAQDIRTLEEIARNYQIPPQALLTDPAALLGLMQQYGRGRFLPIEYDYCAYEGPKSQVLFPGDCYPEPDFTSLQDSSWFIVERRHGIEWIESVVKAYPETAEGFEKMLAAHPKGTEPRTLKVHDLDSLYTRLKTAVGHHMNTYMDTSSHGTGKWTFIEKFRPGRNATWSIVGEENFWIGEMPLPYDLDGKIPFSECVLVDNILHGVGDATARVLTPLQEMHNRQVSQRFDVVDRLLRPNVFTADRELGSNPDRVKASTSGFRFIYSPHGAAATQIENMAPALSAVAAALQDEGSIMRNWQVGTGDSNMSMAANVDPSQNRTATGARLAAFNQDVLTKDLLDRYSMSLAADAELMFLLNRSELSDAINFEARLYNRTSTAAQDVIREAWAKVEPELFNRDGLLTVEVGSTLADDDEAKVQKAQMMFSMFNGHPLVNQEKLRDEVLTSLGKGKELQQFAAPPPQPPPPEDKTKLNVSLSMRFEELPPAVQEMMLATVVLPKAGAPPAMNGAPLPEPPPGFPMGGGHLPPPPAPNPQMAEMATDAAAGAMPVQGELGVESL